MGIESKFYQYKLNILETKNILPLVGATNVLLAEVRNN